MFVVIDGISVCCGSIVKASSFSFCFDFSEFNVAHFRGIADPYNRKITPPMIYIIEKSIKSFRQSSRIGYFMTRPAIILLTRAPIVDIVLDTEKIIDE